MAFHAISFTLYFEVDKSKCKIQLTEYTPKFSKKIMFSYELIQAPVLHDYEKGMLYIQLKKQI